MMHFDKIKVILEVVLEELNQTKQTFFSTDESEIENYLQTLVQIPLEGIDLGIFKTGIKKLLQQKQSNGIDMDIRNIISKSLLLIFFNTTQEERFLHFKEIITHLYNALVQKLIQLKRHQQIISSEDFDVLVRKLIPYVKLEVLLNTDRNEETELPNLKVAAQELYEYILYPNVLREDCYQIIKNKLVDHKVKSLKYEVTKIDEKYGAISEYFQLKISVNQREGGKDYYFFLKVFPTNIDDVFIHIAIQSFRKEEIFYSKFIPLMNTLGYAEITDFLPACYLYVKNTFLAFDQLTREGYTIWNYSDPFSYEQLSVTVKNLAKLHSCTILFEDRFSKLFGCEIAANNYFEDMIVESTIKVDLKSVDIVYAHLDACVYLIEKYSRFLQKENVEKLGKLAKEEFYKLFEVVKPSKKFKNFITHGDSWCNNLMFKNDNTTSLLIDYASLRWVPAGYDFLFTLFANSDKITRDTYFTQLVNDYYDTMRSILDKNGVSIEKVFPKESFLDSLKEFELQIIGKAASYMQLKFLPNNIDPTQGDQSLADHITNSESRVKVLERMWYAMKGSYRIDEMIYSAIELLLSK